MSQPEGSVQHLQTVHLVQRNATTLLLDADRKQVSAETHPGNKAAQQTRN
jgi:hypothetical protein